MANIGLLEAKGHLGVDQDFKITTFPTFANFWCQVFCLFYAKMTISKQVSFEKIRLRFEIYAKF